MAMKLVLLVVIVASLGQGTEQRCSSRQDKINQSKMRTATMCSNPKEIPVQLPVPDGFDYVEPSVVMLKQCTGLACSVFTKTCLPKAANITKHTYRVNAIREDGLSQCEEVTLEEHHACKCGCNVADCSANEEFIVHSCECQCDPLHMHEDACSYRRNMYGHNVMWSRDKCICACDPNTDKHCDSSMEWDPSMCSCVPKYDNYID